MTASRLNLAHGLHREDRLDEAIAAYRQILVSEPGNGDALYLLGVAQFQRGLFAEALVSLDRALLLRPQDGPLHAAKGTVLSSLGQHAEALRAYEQAISVQPQNAMAWHHKANALLELHRLPEALDSYKRAAALAQNDPAIWRHYAIALEQTGHLSETVDCLSRALSLQPADIAAREHRARALALLDRHDDAVRDYGQALLAASRNTHLLYARAQSLTVLKRYPEAVRDCETLLRIDPDHSYARGILVHAKLQCCDWSGLDAQKVSISEGLLEGKRLISPFNHKALSDDPEEQLLCARVWTANEYPPQAPLWRGEIYTHKRIRLAYVSADFNNSANASLMAGVYEHHDKNRFETIAISIGANAARTPIRERLEAAFSAFHDVRDSTPEAIARIMREREIDIAVDLMGHTGECRPAIFAARPAPLQVNYLGFPGTMGAAYYDYILADPVLVPEGEEHTCQEKVIRLPGCYQANDFKRPRPETQMRRSDAGLPEDGFVFCCFNNNYKITPGLFAIWLRLLLKVEDSVLWLVEDNPYAAASLQREAAAQGLAPERLVFAPRSAAAEHLARHRLADLFLDTLPYNAHTTASDALWMDLPVLTLQGRAFAGRVAASLLSALGVPELIAHTHNEYETLALALAQDRAKLVSLRAKIAAARTTSSLFDTALFTRHLEAAYLHMMDRQQRGLPPEHFDVAP